MTPILTACTVVLLSIFIGGYLVRVVRLLGPQLTQGVESRISEGRYVVTWNGSLGRLPDSNKLLVALLLPPVSLMTIASGYLFCDEPSWSHLMFVAISLYLATMVFSRTYGPSEVRVSEDGVHWDRFLPWNRIDGHSWDEWRQGSRLTIQVRTPAQEKTITIVFCRISEDDRNALDAIFHARSGYQA